MTAIVYLIGATVISYAIIIGTYLSYFLIILRNRNINGYIQLVKKIEAAPLVREALPSITIIVPTYNEEKIISKKIQNLSELDYPIDKMDVLIVDDCSTDKTCVIAENVFRELNMRGKVIKNQQRMGANASYNKGVANANGSLILRTDADVVIKADALIKAVRIISFFDNAGGVTGTMMPLTNSATVAATMENSYRLLFSRMSTAESALHSTYVSGGGFALIRKTAFSPIPVDFGSTDANISLSIVRKDFRYLYVPVTFSFEPISCKLSEQRHQKIRRACRLIQSTVLNKDFFLNRKYGEFGKIIFPLRFMMFLICPLIAAIALFETFCLFFLISKSLFVISLIAIGLFLYIRKALKNAKLNFVLSWLFQQFYLISGLILIRKKMSVWKSAERSTK